MPGLRPALYSGSGLSIKQNAPIQERFERPRLFFNIKAPFKLIDPSAGVDQFLPSGIEGMAFRADFNSYVLLCRAYFNNLAASAAYGGLLIIRMDTIFHLISPHLKNYTKR
jgi:hypothetical protein